MNIWNEILGNQVLICAVVGWTVAQVLKTLIDLYLNRSFNPERLFGSGGMPSSHSATVCALTTASGIKYGAGSFEFAVSFVLSMIVMYDATGVRWAAGLHAKAINDIVDYLGDESQHKEKILNDMIPELNESLGHRVIEVICGALLGFSVALIQFFFF